MNDLSNTLGISGQMQSLISLHKENAYASKDKKTPFGIIFSKNAQNIVLSSNGSQNSKDKNSNSRF